MYKSAEMPTLPSGPDDGSGATNTTPQPGRSWGKFVIEKRLGGGGQAAVYQAFDRVGTAGHVALKVPTHPLPPDELHEWVDNEAGPLVKLKHPNIVPVLEAGQVGSFPYVATAIVQGLPLHTHIHTNPPDLKQAVRWIADLADALQAAHAQGVVHRDVKPLNVIITPEGKPVLIDFGVASLLTAYRHESRQDGSGTFPFMAPEQARGAPDADHRVDIFGLGALLKYVLVSRSPYEQHGSTDSALEAARAGHVIRVDETGAPPLRRRLCRIANRALDPDPDRRYQTAAEMAAELRRAIGRPGWLVPTVAGGAAALIAMGVLVVAALRQQPAAPVDGVAAAPGFGLEVLFRRQGPADDYRPLTAGALPLLIGDSVRIHAALPRPLYAYVFALNSGGEARRLYPPEGERAQPVQELVLPAQPGEGIELAPPAGTQTVILLARREPLPAIDATIGRLSGFGAAPVLSGPVLLEGDSAGVRFTEGGGTRRGGAQPVTVGTNYLDRLISRMSREGTLVRVLAFPLVDRSAARAGRTGSVRRERREPAPPEPDDRRMPGAAPMRRMHEPPGQEAPPPVTPEG
jgi:hypothetical protein